MKYRDKKTIARVIKINDNLEDIFYRTYTSRHHKRQFVKEYSEVIKKLDNSICYTILNLIKKEDFMMYKRFVHQFINDEIKDMNRFYSIIKENLPSSYLEKERKIKIHKL